MAQTDLRRWDMEFSELKIGQRFQEETKYIRPSYQSSTILNPPEISSPRVIPLPPLSIESGPNLWHTIQKRRSIRDYDPTPLTLKELSHLLWATQGVTGKASSPGYRTVPSAGALHPIDTYLVVNRVQGLDPGIYFLSISDFSLQEKREGDFSLPIAQAALDQDMAGAAAVVFVWVAVIQRSRWKYRERTYRYIYLDCGHIAQNLYLAATALDLGCCGIAAFFDEEVNQLVGVDGQEQTSVYLATVGKK